MTEHRTRLGSSGESLYSRVKEYLREQWVGALLVTSICTIMNLQFGMLAAVDTITFPIFGYLSSRLAPDEIRPRAVVVEINQETFERRYLGRSPLDRCVLLGHLQQIYAAHPDVVAIDLDLSPALWLQQVAGERHPQSDCEEQIYRLITGKAILKGEGARRVHTVLMQPLPASSHSMAEQASWQQQMTNNAAGLVRFGNPNLPLSFGLTLRQAHRPAVAEPLGLAAAVAELAAHPSADHWIDPRKYRSGLTLLTTEAGGNDSSGITRALAGALDQTERWNASHKRVVFFGAAYGSDMVFRTAIGKLYGVEVHAAAYASDVIDDHAALDFVLDLSIAIFFGIVISWCWKHYYRASLAETPLMRLRARLWIVALFATTMAMMFLFGVFSVGVLAGYGVWIAPIPIAAGMLFDSFVSGSLEAAMGQLHQKPPEATGAWQLLRGRQWLAASLSSMWSLLWLCAVLWALGLVIVQELGKEHL